MGESFRSKSGFTMVQNTVAKDRTISEKALGLYVRIQCYITLPDPVSKRFIMNHCTSGEKAFESSWKELQKLGYLKTYQYRSPNSVTFDTEHDLLSVAEPSTPYFYIVSRPANKISSVWYYPEEGGAKSQNGLALYLAGPLVEEVDRRSIGQLLSSPPQNRGTCSCPSTSFTPSNGIPSYGGDISNTTDNTTYHTTYQTNLSSGGDCGFEEPAKFAAAVYAEGAALAKHIYDRYTCQQPTPADISSVLRCICTSDGGVQTVDQNCFRLLVYAFDRARENGTPGNWKYINGVLAKLKQRGLETVDAAENYDLERLER